jgi:hypothetical protein
MNDVLLKDNRQSVIPNLERVQQDDIATEEIEGGILVRDPSSLGVVLTTSNQTRIA